MKLYKSILLALLAAGLQILLFPRFGYSFLAWIMIVPLLAAIAPWGVLGSFLLGGLYGLVMAISITYWLYYSVVHYFGLSPIMGFGFIVGCCLFYAAVYTGLFTALVSLSRPLVRKKIGLLLVPCFWVTCEILRSSWFTEDPWGLLGYSQYRNLPLIQVADITGIYGVSFVVALVNVATYQILSHLWSRRKEESTDSWTPGDWVVRLALPALLLAAVILYGQVRLRQYDPAAQGGEKIKVAVVQGSIHREYRWKSIYYGKNLSKYIRMSRQPEALEAELVVWPENAVNFHPDREALFLKLMMNSLKTPPRTLLTGAPHMVQNDQGDKSFFNAAFKITGQGIEKLYKKIHLMPFSERKPAWVVRALASPGEAPSKFSPGEEHTLFTLNGNRFASPICFEMVYPELIRRFVENGAQFLVNISNDSWFGPTSGPWQHLAFSPLRAVENRRHIVRAANTGISAFITPTGKILDPTELDKPALILGAVTPLNEMTFYTKNGDVFATVCTLATLVSVLVCFRSRRRA